jgi:hypothetical protein
VLHTQQGAPAATSAEWVGQAATGGPGSCGCEPRTRRCPWRCPWRCPRRCSDAARGAAPGAAPHSALSPVDERRVGAPAEGVGVGDGGAVHQPPHLLDARDDVLVSLLRGGGGWWRWWWRWARGASTGQQGGGFTAAACVRSGPTGACRRAHPSSGRSTAAARPGRPPRQPSCGQRLQPLGRSRPHTPPLAPAPRAAPAAHPPTLTCTPAKSVTSSVNRPLRSTGQGTPSPFSITPLARHTR